jgi:hypothetical protein
MKRVIVIVATCCTLCGCGVSESRIDKLLDCNEAVQRAYKAALKKCPGVTEPGYEECSEKAGNEYVRAFMKC